MLHCPLSKDKISFIFLLLHNLLIKMTIIQKCYPIHTHTHIHTHAHTHTHTHTTIILKCYAVGSCRLVSIVYL